MKPIPITDDEARRMISEMTDADRLSLIDQLRRSDNPKSAHAYRILCRAYFEDYGTWPKPILMN